MQFKDDSLQEARGVILGAVLLMIIKKETEFFKVQNTVSELYHVF